MDTSRLLFISHSHQDDPFCLRLIADLRANLGEEAVWYDTSGGLHGGDNWWNRIIAEITERPYFLVVLSPNAWESKWVPEEMAIAYRQKVELGKRLLPVRLADAPRREDWKGIQEFDFIHKEYAAALTEVLHAVDTSLIAPVIGAPPISPTSNAPERQLSPTERLAQETHAAYGLEHWSDVLDKTQVLIERNAMTPVLWRERASAAFAIGDNNGGLAVIKQALTAGVDDSDTLLLYVRLTAKAGDDNQAIEILTRAYALASLDDTATRLAILDELTAVLARLGRWDDFKRRVGDGRRIAPDDPRFALREVEVLLKTQRFSEAAVAARALPSGVDVTSALPAWRSAISSSAMGPTDGENWPTYRALLETATHSGIDPAAIMRWHRDFPHFVPRVTLPGYRECYSMAWSHDGIRLAILGRKVGDILDASSGRLLVTLSDPATSMKRMLTTILGETNRPTILTSASWSPNGTRLAAATDDKMGEEKTGIVARVWDATSGLPVMALRGGSYSSPPKTAVAWSPGAAYIATAGSDWDEKSPAQIWDASSGRLVVTLTGSQKPLVWSPDGNRLATAGGGGVQIWDASGGHLLATLVGYQPLAWSPDSGRLAMRGRSEIEIWEIASKRQLVALYSSSGIAALSWTIDGERLIGAKYQQPMMWDAASGQEIGNLSSQFLGHGDGVILISWMSDGTRLAVINDKGLTIWGAE